MFFPGGSPTRQHVWHTSASSHDRQFWFVHGSEYDSSYVQVSPPWPLTKYCICFANTVRLVIDVGCQSLTTCWYDHSLWSHQVPLYPLQDGAWIYTHILIFVPNSARRVFIYAMLCICNLIHLGVMIWKCRVQPWVSGLFWERDVCDNKNVDDQLTSAPLWPQQTGQLYFLYTVRRDFEDMENRTSSITVPLLATFGGLGIGSVVVSAVAASNLFHESTYFALRSQSGIWQAWVQWIGYLTFQGRVLIKMTEHNLSWQDVWDRGKRLPAAVRDLRQNQPIVAGQTFWCWFYILKVCFWLSTHAHQKCMPTRCESSGADC